MANQSATESFAAELQSLREVIPHAAKLGAVQTNISIELLTVLLAMHDSGHVADQTSKPQDVLGITQESVEHLLHARRELTRSDRSPQRIRNALAQKITDTLAPVLNR